MSWPNVSRSWAESERLVNERLSMRQAADKLEVSYSTLKGWLDRLDLNIPRNTRGEYQITSEILTVLETVKALRDQDMGLDTIERKIGPSTERHASGSVGQAIVPEVMNPGSANGSSGSRADGEPLAGDGADDGAERLTASIVSAVRSELQVITELSEKYARAAHEIGKLESTVKHLEAQVGDAGVREEAALERERTARERLAAAEAERDEVRRRAEEAEARARRLEETLAQPWYKRWFGR